MASVKTNDGTNAMPDDAERAEDEREQPRQQLPKREPKSEAVAPRAAAVPSGRARGGFFTIYKKGQGYWTRMGTVMGAGLIGIFAMQFLYEQVRAYTSPRTAWIADAVFLAVYAIVFYLITNKPTVVDFLIATDSEMKKVNWTTKAELIGSTKVVILFMIIIMIFLFCFDTIFGYFFYLIRVLQVGPFG
jgi:preprotein translocase SecE subunit